MAIWSKQCRIAISALMPRRLRPHDSDRMSISYKAIYAADRIATYATQQGWRAEASKLLIEVLHRGEIARGDAGAITGLGERTARALLSQLIQERVLGSDTEKWPVSLRFPVRALDVLFPRLVLES